MPEIRQQFINSAVENLEFLKQKIFSAKDFPDVFIKEIFRQIHTIKGTAQTFGLKNASHIAHELESILSDYKIKPNNLIREILLENITALKESFDEKNAGNSDKFIEKIKTSATRKPSTQILPELPENILNSLSRSEIESLSTAFGNGKTIFCFEIYFALTDFREKLLKFREILEQHGEIIATLSAARKDLHIGFRFLFAGKINLETIRRKIEMFSPKVVFEVLPIKEKLLHILREITAHGENLAKKLGKQIEFEIFIAEIFPSNKQIKIVFDVLLHLIKNAIDHAIEIPSERIEKGKKETGKIEIRFLRENDDLKIMVSDDGKGIDEEKIKLKAIEKKLLSDNEDLNEQEMLNLIFLSGFSTAKYLTEISGRGVGLDAVKQAVENAGGTIKVERRKENGTMFEIILPPEI